MINAYMDIQSLANYAKQAMGDEHSKKFMMNRHKDLNHLSPHSFYLEYPSKEHYQLILDLIKQWCRNFN